MNTLTRQDLIYLVALCDAEVGRCGLDTEAGRKARAMGDKLTACIVTYPGPVPARKRRNHTQERP